MLDPLVHLVLRCALALLFATAAAHKLRDPRAFTATVRGYALVPSRLAGVAAFALVAAELALTVGLLAPATAPASALAAVALLALYTAAIAVNLARGRRDLDCGCLGPRHRQPLSGWLLARNGLLALAALAVVPAAGARALTWLDAGTGVAALATVVLLFHAAQQLAASALALAVRRSP